jgi:tetratricopeptide (TPR) repeat protein
MGLLMRLAPFVLCALLALPARADDRAAAEELFLRGKAAMAQQDFAHACKFFEDSYKLDPAMGTLLNMAVCHRDSGHVSTAWGEFKQLEGQALRASPPQLDRARVAREQADALYPRVSRIKILVLPSVRVPGIEVSVDGRMQAESLWDIGVPADPGTHTIRATAPGKVPFEKSIKIDDERQTPSVQVLPLRAAPPGAVVDGKQQRVGPTLVEAEEAASARAQRVAGFIVAAGGGAALITGTVFGVLAAGASSDAAKCGPEQRCQRYGNTNFADADAAFARGNVYANVANILVPLGLIAGGIGAYLILSARRSSSDSGKSRVINAPIGASFLTGSF